MVADGPPFRLLPRLDDANRFFWTSGGDGKLRFLCCATCRHLIHPPAPRCPLCLGDQIAPTAVSGRATVVTYTVNHQQWLPGAEPYIIGLVALVEQDDIRLTTNLVGVDPADIRSGMGVEVVFEAVEDVYLPLFRPAPA